MNLHGIVAGPIAAVNPMTTVVLQQSTGYTVTADGTQIPTYTPLNASVQIQGLSIHELKHLESLNIQGVLRKVYAYGSISSIVRAAVQGGDLLTFGGRVWKAVHVFETWPDWCAVAVKMQVDL